MTGHTTLPEVFDLLDKVNAATINLLFGDDDKESPNDKTALILFVQGTPETSEVIDAVSEDETKFIDDLTQTGKESAEKVVVDDLVNLIKEIDDGIYVYVFEFDGEKKVGNEASAVVIVQGTPITHEAYLSFDELQDEWHTDTVE